MSERSAKAQRRRDRSAMRHLMLETIGGMRALLRRRGPEMRQRFPKSAGPCATCAFTPSTDSWSGMDATVWGLVQAIRNDQPFYCHEGMPIRGGEYRPEPGHHYSLCGGYAMIVGDPDAKLAFARAARGVK